MMLDRKRTTATGINTLHLARNICLWANARKRLFDICERGRRVEHMSLVYCSTPTPYWWAGWETLQTVFLDLRCNLTRPVASEDALAMSDKHFSIDFDCPSHHRRHQDALPDVCHMTHKLVWSLYHTSKIAIMVEGAWPGLHILYQILCKNDI